MTLTLFVALLLSPAFADSVQSLYGRQEASELAGLCAKADERSERLLCRYRLYPLTEQECYVNDLPEALGADASATEVALLAGLWGYRASRGSVMQTIRAGRRASMLLKHARTLDANDPYLLLIKGQSLLFRPSHFGGDVEAALSYLRRLRALLNERPRPGISPMEVDVWIWYAMEKTEDANTEEFRRELLRRAPPPLYRKMIAPSSSSALRRVQTPGCGD